MDNLFDLIDNVPPEKGENTDTGANAPVEFSVSEISQKLKHVVEGNFSYVRVRGELSRVTIAKSGHIYTALKDENACLDAICWRGAAGSLSIQPEEGLDVVVTGRLTTYPGRSNYQIIIESMELAGEGALLKMLEERRKKLAAEGLFDESHKKPIPFLPTRIGVITSPTGAVIRDIMHRLNDRFPRPVLLWPALVQGDQAAAQVIAGIKGFNALPESSPHRPDVIIIARGGGALEDLMPFNDEALVRAIAASTIPIISAIGHETDTTLADYAADLRAPTPTGAAEKCVPVRQDLLNNIAQTGLRLNHAIRRFLREQKNHFTGISRGLIHPKSLLENKAQRLDALSDRLDHGLRHAVHHSRNRLTACIGGLTLGRHRQNITHHKTALADLQSRLNRNILRGISDRKRHLSATTSMLETLSFHQTLARGFAIIKDENGRLVTSNAALTSGRNINIELKDGTSGAKID